MRTSAARSRSSLDRKSFIQIMFEGNADIGGAMLPPPAGVWGMPPEELKTVIGYGDDVKKNRDEARKLMEKAGFGPNKRLDAEGFHPQSRDLSRSGRDPDRPAQGHLYRRRARRDRERHLVRQGGAQGIPDRPQPHRRRHRRSGPDLLRELRLRLGAQLHQLLQQGPAGAVRRAIAGEGRRQAQEAGVGDRQEAAGGRGAADPLSLAPGHLLGSPT